MLAALAEKFGMTVVAEGVETEDQIATLLQHGIREGQGHVYSKPVPATTILAMAAKEAAGREQADGRRSLLKSA
jgi:c-di-GMP phosphodiesterase